jgi:predicted enzyme related to lactoylglutathione lyase
MNVDLAQELLNELGSSLENLETQHAALFQFLKDNGMLTGDQFASYLAQAGKASSVRWRAAHIRLESLSRNERQKDISGPEFESLKVFYSKAFGWKVDEKGPGYALVGTPSSQMGGAIIDTEEAALTIGIAVDDLDTAIASAVQGGGSIVMPKTDNGWVIKGQVTDPVGNRLTLIQK